MLKIYTIIITLIFATGELFAHDDYGLILQNNSSTGLTSFELTDGESMSVKESLNLGFKFSTYSHRTRFGYITRLIFNNETTLNLVVNTTKPGVQTISAVNDGCLISNEPILCDSGKAYEWNDVSIGVTPRDSLITININGVITKYKRPLPLNSDVRVTFGANDIEGFIVRDVPNVIIRDVELRNGELHRLWRLREHSGDFTTDDINGQELLVKHPLWECDQHSAWSLEKEIIRKERLFPVYNGTNKLHIISQNGVLDYNLELGRGTERKFAKPIAIGNSSNQFVYDNRSGKLRYFDSNAQGDFHSALNNNKREWEPHINRATEAVYHQGNIFISPIDNQLTQLFGYGFFRYKATRFSTNMKGVTRTHELDSIAPRYLSSAAIVGDLCYIYGGIGNESGRQELGAQTLHDLHCIDLRSGKSRKIWDLKRTIAEEVACQNMVIMPDNPDYGISLFYNPSLSETELNLKAVNLKEPEIVELLHDPIPYNFKDVESQAQLIYVESLSKLFAITVDKRSSEEYRVRIYSIAYPVVDLVREEESGNNNLIWVVIVVLIAGGGAVAYYVRRKRAIVQKQAVTKQPNQPHTAPKEIVERDITIVPKVKRTGIYLLDGFTIIDKEQNDITNEFAPLMKQLLSLIILYTHKSGKGVSNTTLKDVLWFDKSDASARNNRSVTISKIRQSLQKVGGFQIVFNNSYWHIEYSEGDFCDYAYACQTIDNIGSAAEESRVAMLSDVAQMGDLLPNQMFDFFDGFKAEYASRVIDSMNDLLQQREDLNDKITLTNLILRFDKVDESATREKCLALIKLGKNGLAKTTFDNFTREYTTLFGEEFESSFDEFVKE